MPSVKLGVPSMEAALMEGTPGLTPEDLQLPALPPVDEEVSTSLPNTYQYSALLHCAGLSPSTAVNTFCSHSKGLLEEKRGPQLDVLSHQKRNPFLVSHKPPRNF